MKEGFGSNGVLAEPENDKVSPSQVLSKTTDDEVRLGSSYLNGNKSLLCSSALNEKTGISSLGQGAALELTEGSLDEECGGDGNVDYREAVGFVNGKNRRGIDGEEEDGIRQRKEKEKVTDDNMDRKGQVFAGKNGSEDKGDREENKGVVVGKGNCPEYKMVDSELEQSDQSCDEVMKEVEDKYAISPKVLSCGQSDHMRKRQLKLKRGRPPKVQVNVQSDNEGRYAFKNKGGRSLKVQEENLSDAEIKKSKCKRGRPPKVKDGDQSDVVMRTPKRDRGRPSKVQNGDQSNVDRRMSERKRGRPPKAQDGDHSNAEISTLKRKRGRPPKAEGSNKVLHQKFNNCTEMFGFRRSKRKIKVRDSLGERMPNHLRLSGKVSEVKRSLPARKGKCRDTETEVNNDSIMPASNSVNALEFKDEKGKGGKTRLEEDGEQTVSEAKKLVRERIVKLLLAAGWTVEYRPRRNRDYSDAVYVNPEGKTHWSVTLAYRIFKEQCKGHADGSNAAKVDSSFIPIQEEELSMLKRVSRKERKDKGKPKRKGGDTADELTTENEKLKEKLQKQKLQKEKVSQKLNPVTGPCGKAKSLKRGSASLHKQCGSDGISLNRISTSVRNCKQRETQSRKPGALLVRNSLEAVESDSDGYPMYEGKRTVLTWMIDLATVPLNGKVKYYNGRKTQVLLEGRITKEGIQCDCCSKVFTISGVENHVGGNANQPLQHIYLENGNSLLQCLLGTWNKQDESKNKGFHFVDFGNGDPNDDTCGICGDGGDLICCDGCPSTFHQSCLDIKKFPSGDWHCVYCSCKFCGMVNEATYGRDHCDDTAPSALFTCCLCEEKYHKACSGEKDATDDEQSSLSFCGLKCQELFERLQMLVGVKHELPEGFSWTLLRRSAVDSDVSLSEVSQKIESNSKLAVALLIMDECFLPLVDHRSGINLIHNIVYNFGSNFNRLNYNGFLTTILERGDEIIAAASIRIHGNKLAEMPFIGTRFIYRRQGMCRRLLSAIESALCALKVEKLVIPAIAELTATWTSVFGFKPIETSSKQKMKNMNVLAFPGVDMLEKPLLKPQFSEETTTPTDGLSSRVPKEQRTMDKVADTPDQGCSTGFDLHIPVESAVSAHERNNETAATEFSSQLCDGSLNVTSMTETNAVSDSGFGKRKNIARHSLKSHDENTVYCSDEINLTQSLVLGLTASDVNAVTCHSRATSKRAQGVKDSKLPISQQLWVTECFPDSNQRMLENIELEDKLPVVQHMPVSGDMTASTECPSSLILSKTSNFSGDVNHQTSHSAQGVQDFANGQCTRLSAVVASGSKEVDVNGVCDLKETLNGDAILDRLKMNTKSSEQPGSDSQVDDIKLTQHDRKSFCSSTSGSGVALHCASNGANSVVLMQ